MIKRSAANAHWGVNITLIGMGLGILGCAEGVEPGADLEWERSNNELGFKASGWQQEYFSIRPDYRKCAAPLCGGHFAQAVNRHRTRCADGSVAPECYVAELKYDGSLPNTDHVLVRGSIESNVSPDFGELGQLVISEMWGSATAAKPSGAFFRVSNSGIVCITTPCPTVQLERLNTPWNRTVSATDLEAVGASPEQLDAAVESFRCRRIDCERQGKKG